MSLVRNKVFGVLFWLVTFAAVIAGAITGGKIGNGGAPEFGDGSGASASSHLLFGIGGALFCGGLVLALFSAIWMAMWALDHRSHPRVTGDVNEDTFEALDFDGLDFEPEWDDADFFSSARR